MKTAEERLAFAEEMQQAGLHRVKTSPPPPNQKFPPGSFVRLLRHQHWLPYGTLAQVKYTYAHAFGGTNAEDYSLLVRFDQDGLGTPVGHWNSVSWFHERELEAVTDPALIAELTADLEKRNKT